MSYGGSAILMNLVAIAVVLRIDYENKVLMRGGRRMSAEPAIDARALSSWRAAPAGTSSRAWPWPRPCASARWRVHWLGAPGSMESQLVPPRGFAFETIAFSRRARQGRRRRWLLLPLRLLKAFWQSIQVVRRVKPDVVIGLGGYISFPAGMMSVLLGKPLVLHEQNSVAGMANRVLAGVADRVFTAFPERAEEGAAGSAIRCAPAFLQQPGPAERLGVAQRARCACWWWAAAWAPRR